jgi:transcription-repair coupling factor (superfamily II helicase)
MPDVTPSSPLALFQSAWSVAARRDVVHLAVPALPGAAAAAAVITASREGNGAVVAVTADPDELEALYTDLRTLLRGDEETEIVLFPPDEAAPGDEIDPELSGTRQAALRRLKDLPGAGAEGASGTGGGAPRGPFLFLTTLGSLLRPIPDPDALGEASIALAVDAETPFEALVGKLAANGYERLQQVAEKGEMAIRGGILDIWPLTRPLPVRLEFFGDTVESIRAFDPGTQVSVEQLPDITIPPLSTRAFPCARLAEWLPEGCTVFWLDHDRLRREAEEAALAGAAADAGGDAPRATEPVNPLRAWERVVASVSARHPRRHYFCGEPPPPRTLSMDLDVVPPPGLGDLGEEASHPEVTDLARRRLLAQLAGQAAEGEEVHVFLDTAGSREWLARELGEDTPVNFVRGVLSGGFLLPSKRLSVLAQSDLYAVRKRSGYRTVPPSVASLGGRLDTPADLSPGDLVVHVDHGVGRFLGTTEIEIGGQRSEVFTIEYADGAKLHVPVSQVHLLSRYIGLGGARGVRLHSLGGKRWTREKTAAERAVIDLAASLLETQARRAACPGIAFDIEPGWMEPFEAAFPFRETADQLRVIAEVKEDMAKPRPMDRLICGDAGYGKTEIAIRAAFIAAMNGRQTAVLVPTTILAEQHYGSFRERMGGYPLRIDVLSRFRTPSERARTLGDLASGRVDIVIGTHALLQPGVRFRDLGLVILDEEQRFGVAHKERLKQVRALVDVLTLSATPIPRTLYLSMTGARDLSLLQTPPLERLPIETRLVRDSDSEIRTAILREMRRNGQVYYLYNRVLTIGLARERLARVVPEARVIVAHGQMPPGELADAMRRFERGDADVLLCTTIAGSGIDIPRANTILIDRADRFGMADLYQLRGRVGRSSHKGFACLLLPPHGHLDSDARERLAALQRHGGLGGGFNLAMRDLEIRGAGNLLGAAQSGHIAAIGFALYCQLLRRTVARLKGETPPMLVDVDLQIEGVDFSPGSGDPDSGASLPYAYVEEDAQRMLFHRRIAEASTVGEVRALRTELADRFGKPPPAAVRLLRLAELRVAAAKLGVRRIEAKDGVARIYRHSDRSPFTIRGRLPRLRTGADADARIAALFKVLRRMGE